MSRGNDSSDGGMRRPRTNDWPDDVEELGKDG